MLNVVSGERVPVSSELLLAWASDDFKLEEAPNIAFKRFHFFFEGGGGGGDSEDEDSEVEEPPLLFFGFAGGSGGAGGTTRSKETNKLAGDN